MSAAQMLKNLSLSKTKAKSKDIANTRAENDQYRSDPEVKLPMPQGKSILDKLPNEIIILIADQMDSTTRENLSRCSKLCYDLAVRKFLNLTDEEIARFQDGGDRAGARSLVRYVKIQASSSECGLGSKWYEDISKMPRGYDISEAFYKNSSWEYDRQTLITRIRTYVAALRLFPAIQELLISYEAPRGCEFNIYLAILRGIIGQPFCGTLRRLEFQIIREGNLYAFPEMVNTFSSSPARTLSFEQVCMTLSAEDQQFIRDKQYEDNDTINRSMSEIVPKLPELREMRIVAYDLPTPLNDLTDLRFEQTAFYYIPLAFAPKLERLCVETESCVVPKDRRRAYHIRLNPQFLIDVFPLITDLRIINSHIENSDIERLVVRFPRLKFLDYQPLCRYQRNRSYANLEGLNLIGTLKELEYIRLPWPCLRDSKDGSIAPMLLKRWVDGLLERGLDHLRTVELQGSKSLGPTIWRTDIDLKFLVERSTGNELKVHMSGATVKEEYLDHQ